MLSPILFHALLFQHKNVHFSNWLIEDKQLMTHDGARDYETLKFTFFSFCFAKYKVTWSYSEIQNGKGRLFSSLSISLLFLGF
jgi:hypothetical protein